MAFFSLKQVCCICNEEVGLNRFQIANKEWLCPKCFKKCNFTAVTPIGKMTANEIMNTIKSIENNTSQLNSFVSNKKIAGCIEVDDQNKKFLLPKGTITGLKYDKVYDFTDILDFELIEDGETITKGGIGRAVTGGVLFGGVGAVVGGVTGKKKNKPICTQLQIKICINDINNPAMYITFISSSMKKDGLIYKQMYKTAQECTAVLEYICNNQPIIEQATTQVASSADEILKYKQLLDCGAITQEEFDIKKKQLLGL